MPDYGSGHWYTEEGEARHWQEDGKRTTLRHARSQNLFPSVSGILGMISNDFLNSWKIDNHLKLAFCNRPKMKDTEEAYLRRIRGMAGEEQGQILDFGTRTHAALEAINNHYLDEQRRNTK
tara:strand:- start:1021 stop:1383 length:363 start_codon:yes stop_codon:yes gene_type:complete